MITDFSKTINGTKINLKSKILTVDNGLLMRQWKITDYGMVTTNFKSGSPYHEWCLPNYFANCDWELPGHQEKTCELVAIDAELSDDEGFTSEHVMVNCLFHYKKQKLDLNYQIWIYPGFSGMRTQLKIRYRQTPTKEESIIQQGKELPSRRDYIPVNIKGLNRTYLGYHSDTQNRNDTSLDILKEQTLTHNLRSPEWNTWGSAVCLENISHGLAMVKESHKCVNKAGHETGLFITCPKRGLINTGWGMYSHEIPEKKYADSWASWVFCWDTDKSDRETAFKKFDRRRYPIHPEKDAIIQANTWGSTKNSFDARNAAGEDSILQEIDVCAELGIDVLQIDDGWQTSNDNTTWKLPEGVRWLPHTDKYSSSWKNVVAKAKDKGVKFGLWAAAEYIPFEDMVENWEKLGFVQLKLDFANLQSREQIDTLMNKARRFIKHTGHQAKVNWDLTEIAPRYGYFFGREYGSIYLENRKPVFPSTTTYRPASVLRDLWLLSKYVNLNKFQCSYQNIDMVNTELSNANFYNHAYCLAITLMGIPLVFMETKHLSEAAKQEIIPLINTYKNVREEMFNGYVYPIGDTPDDASWTGFQSHSFTTGNGFITIFRELNNDLTEASITLRNIPVSTNLKLTDLISGETRNTTLDKNKQVKFSINETPGFRFYKYETL